MSTEPDDTDYTAKYFSPTHSRTDSYKDGQIVRTSCTDLETLTFTLVIHTHKHYISSQITEEGEGFLAKNEDWLSPGYLPQRIRSCEHKELGRRTIEGVLCEGVETTDPAVLEPLPGVVTRLDVEMRLWIDAKTQHPVRFEARVDGEAEGQRRSSKWIMDHFQWDVELDPSLFKLNLADYEDMRNM